MPFPYAYYQTYYDGPVNAQSLNATTISLGSSVLVGAVDVIIDALTASYFVIDPSLGGPRTIASIANGIENQVITIVNNDPGTTLKLNFDGGSNFLFSTNREFHILPGKSMTLLCRDNLGSLDWQPTSGYLEDGRPGDLQTSFLSEVQFQTVNGPTWVNPIGQSIVGSDLQVLTGLTILTDCTERFVRPIGTGIKVPGSTEEDQNKSHDHDLLMYQDNGAGTAGNGNPIHGLGSTNAQWKTTDASGGAEARPKNVAANLFVKINY